MEKNPDTEKIFKELETLKHRVSSNNEIINSKLNYNTEKFSLIEEKLNLLLSWQNNSSPISLGTKLDQFSKYIIPASTIRLGDNLAVTKLFNGQRMIVDVRDMTLAQCIMFDGIDEKWVTEVFLGLLKPDNVFFDLGANFGYYSILAGSKITRGRIYSFEANPDLIHILNKNLMVNGLRDRGFVENYAVSDKPGRTNLHIYKDSKGNSSTRTDPDLILENTIDVETISIDHYCTVNNITKADMVKIDVEGMEDKAYEGMKKIITTNHDIKIFIEFSLQRYEQPHDFYKKMSSDFNYIYHIIKNPSQGKRIQRILSFEHLSKLTDKNWHLWEMLLLSRNKLVI